ncbi:response regulator [Roseburia sp. BX1005]|uniref:Stage 0 sporulation protein A homolog n=1 Tax=Roseburia zhanii TaxID=2763064 RepID=A0A923LMK5_9FIRM|nr:response regulator [Roseburia zhanii]MBC5713052.1 response regulator [Roseburia zhanii]
MIKVFLVEDEIIIREAIHKMIPWAEYGFELIGEAKDGEMALPLIKKSKPDVLITDIKMPFMDGLTLSRLVKKDLPNTKIIIISGYDDFDYARQAITLGIEQYLLKPISKDEFLEVLEGIRSKYKKENEQKLYYQKFENEIKAYEKNAQRDFFELLVSEDVDLQRIYEQADRLQIDIMAQCYNLVLFDIGAKSDYQNVGDRYSNDAADVQNKIDEFFINNRSYQLFRNQQFNYAVLIKGDENEIGQITAECIEFLKTTFEQNGTLEWFVCAGKSVERLSMMSECYKEAMKSFAYRYLGYRYVFSYENIEKTEKDEDMNLQNIDMNAVKQEIIYNFLFNALDEEVDSFVKNYLQMIGGEAMRSKMFQQYILLNLHFCLTSFAEKLGYDKTEIDDSLKFIVDERIKSTEDLEKIIGSILRKGIRLREERSKGRNQSVIRTALQYMEENFTDDSLTLNRVAGVANVSANHFSALFSQEMGQTFIEYLTQLRMNRAKEQLRCTDMRSGEIALEVGYKDPHYFSFLFKKTQGCTPSEYRNQTRSQK